SGTSKASSYKNYLAKVTVLAIDSNRLGNSLAQAISTPGIKAGDLASKMNSLAQQQQIDEKTAAGIKPPAQLAVAHRSLAKALQLGAGSTNVSEVATNLATQTQYLVASDVLWSSRFRAPTRSLIDSSHITGLVVPASQFLHEQGVDSSSFWSPVVTRLNGNSTSGGNTSGHAVGTQLIGVSALPKNQQLSPTSLNTVVDTTNLGFAVQVKNSGDVQVAGVQVTLTIKQAKPISATRTIALINPGQSATVTFKGLTQPQFVVKTTLEVDVKPVPGESNPGNNSASYPVIFSLG